MNKKYCKKELSELQRLKLEIQELKKENKTLHNLLKRIDPDRPDIKQYYDHKKKIENKKNNRKLYKKWTCHDCGNGVLRTIIFSKANGDKYYFRKCDSCENKTKSKKFQENIEIVR